MIRQELVDDLIQQGLGLVDEVAPVIRGWRRGAAIEATGIDRAFRALHTIKGSFGFIGMSRVSELAHVMEDSIADLREMLVNATPELLRLLEEGAAALRSLISDPGPESANDADRLLRRLRRLRQADDDDPFEESPLRVPTQQWPLEPTQSQGARAQRLGRRIFRITLLHERDIEGRGRSSVDLGEMLLAIGDPLSVEVDLSAIHGLEDCLERDLVFQVLLMTDAGAGDCSDLLEVEAAQIEEIDLHAYIPQEFHTARIMRRTPGASQASVQGGLKAMLQAMGGVAQDLAGRVGKSIRFAIRTCDHPLSPGLRQQLQGALAHLLRNAIDHGIESAAARAAAGKREAGTIDLDGSVENGRLRLRIRDDGAGIDPAAIVRRAVQRGLIPSPERYQDNQQAALELVFLPGFSTAATITELSGRGMGMDVVRRVADSAGGSVTIRSQPGQGTEVMIELPVSG